ncbi:hypothetical protein P43SY_000790 [Pythium insidiosum]|uniref:Branchpoint-bridging protein n=1 Tax=Pythium insidiosum TaxID=114742 RepID=A0AAD5Q7R4_PYTIN|nr:hypothetical protein P43SY_000790 [Pythium insidiosum]
MADDSNGYAAFMAFMNQPVPTAPPAADATDKRDREGAAAAAHDGYSYEEEQEREAMMKSYHPSMKQWFRENPHLTDKYGQYPLFWQDLKTWAPYREVLKHFLRETEGGGKADDTTGTDASASASASATTSSSTSQAASSTSTDAATTSQTSDSGAAGTDDSQPKRRKKSRWGDAAPEEPAAEGEKRRKKSRWAPAAPAANLAGLMNPLQGQALVLRAKLDTINQKLQTVAVDAARIEKDPNRSPSPPPQYDANGKRTNTREVRMRAALERERQDVIAEMVKVNPLYRPPADFLRQKLSRKIYIPIKEYPGYNFIGLIIGPRGNTQKRMEKETNCKIAIRGKGSVKEGSKGKKMHSDENDDLHVLITGEREEDLERAAKEVQSLLVPVDDMKNEHKQKQLRELALINGTLRDDDFCHLCGEKGHRQWECPNRERSFKPVNVKCAICGDSSHPTRDCTQRGKSATENAEINKEYEDFMQQLGEKPIISSASKPAAAAAPWLQPSKASTTAQPWLSDAAGAPGMSDVPPPPGTTGAPAMGSTPATAFPPPGVAAAPAAPTLGSTPATAFPPPTAAYAYASQGTWDQYGAGYYYGTWDQSGAAANGAYQYAHYGAAPSTATDPNTAGADYSGYQYPTTQGQPPY